MADSGGGAESGAALPQTAGDALSPQPYGGSSSFADAGEPSPELNINEVSKVTQTILQNACKRRKLSSSGAKKVLAARLVGAGFKTAAMARQLSVEFERDGVDVSASGNLREKAPNWTIHETARLCHVIQSPLHSTTLARLYCKPASRAELDRGRHDPWTSEFAAMFNDEDFTPRTPDCHNGVTEDILAAFDPLLHPHQRDGAQLKTKWNKLRSKYTAARETFCRSGQGDADVFPDFTDGDPCLSYMHCVFFDSPSLEYVVRIIPSDARVEEGIEGIDGLRNDDPPMERPRKKSSASILNAGLEAIAKSLATPIPLGAQGSTIASGTGKAFEQFDISDRMANTVDKLMDLETTLLAKISAAQESQNSSYADVLQGRLQVVQDRIRLALDQ